MARRCTGNRAAVVGQEKKKPVADGINGRVVVEDLFTESGYGERYSVPHPMRDILLLL